MKLSEATDGMKVEVDAGFTCMKAGVKTVETDIHGGLFVECDHGRHFLDGQEGPDGKLIGIKKFQSTCNGK